mmetsp:Transcript_21855/g.62276  ORF Transcript_21855/g.62276 Transcript_21855/m.62276 type:complete len:476 (-) Transcript_21855:58-1485(-)|eukprot:CAMPEP_0119561282 /NCGR_PEP_ID=MMETSP1352-20130426/17165_1 /TAXON_ID=265584 /ORGANISM="Stauroneis constricta, Strain CCMP1120" /LENGTH=475 /DNA_ID=CAMNT_0007609455 /DNA_START=131 /DNA_END=1558 /DNA_ORIENTATION=+
MKIHSFSSMTTSLLLALLAITRAAFASTIDDSINNYSFDCSFPIFDKEKLTECAIDLGDKVSFYENYMDGCRQKFGADVCNNNENERIEMNTRQPNSLLNFTDKGYMKIRAPENVVKLINHFWESNKNNTKPENWYTGNIYTNHWESPTDFVSIEDSELEGAGPELADAIWDAAKTTIEAWTGMKQRPSSVYGVRVYNEGAVLSPHCDRMPLISSAIVNVAQDVDEDWPIEVYGHDGLAVNVTMEPGDMVLYESGTIIHGRPFPLKGRFYANIFIHFEPVGFMDGRPFVNKDDPDLAPYVQAGSLEAEYQHEYYINAPDDRVNLDVHSAAGDGSMAKLQLYARRDSTQLHFKDDNGWQPIHEACRNGHTEAVRFLIDEHHANFNSRTDFGIGESPLTLAIKHNGADHELVKYLEGLGAEQHEWQPPEHENAEEYEYDGDGEYEEDEYEYDGDEDEDENEEDEHDGDENDEEGQEL